MIVNFDQEIDRRKTNCTKYDGMEVSFGRGDILPLWIADMDFPVPEEVTAALQKRWEHPIYGYNYLPSDYYDSFLGWQKRRHGWEAQKEWLCHTPGVLTALAAAILAFTEKGDSILIQSPVYTPFSGTIEALGRIVLNNELVYENGYFTMDFEDFERKAEKARLLILCNPHNPSGRVWKKEELERVEDICRRNRLLVFSDEIHSDIVYAPNRHTVFAQVSEWSRDNCIVAMAPSKTFNMAGLEMSIVAIANKKRRSEYQYLLRYGLHVANPNSFGIPAVQAAYEWGEEWYEALLTYLKLNLDYLDRALSENVSRVRLVKPEATYIPLLDMRALNQSDESLKELLIHHAGVALNAGVSFGPGGEGFMRINVATQREKLKIFVESLKRAVEQL